MQPKTSFIFIILLLIASASGLTRPGSTRPSPADQLKPSNVNNDKNKGGRGNDYGGGAGGFFGPREGFSVPGFRNGFGSGIEGGGYGVGYGGRNGGHSKDGVIRPSVVCEERGPCYQKKVTCPARCFFSFSHSGKDYASGGGGGGCTIDCKMKCNAYC